MKINEIVVNELVGTGINNPAMQSEEWRATEEFKTLKKFSPEFANKFMQKFQQLGRISVDAAYQSAAEERKREMESSGSTKSAIVKELAQGQEAHKEAYEKTKLKYADMSNRTGNRGGQFGNTNATKYKKGMERVKDLIADISSPVKALSTGYYDVGDWLKKQMGTGVKIQK